MSDFFLRASDSEKRSVIREAAQKANREQANVMSLAAQIGSKAKN